MLATCPHPSPLPEGEGTGRISPLRLGEGTCRQQPANLVHQAGGEHFADAAVDPGVQLGPRPVEHEHAALVRQSANLKLPLHPADRLAGFLEHFQGSNQPAGIIGVQSGGGRRIDLDQTGVEPGGPVLPGLEAKRRRSGQSAGGPWKMPRSSPFK